MDSVDFLRGISDFWIAVCLEFTKDCHPCKGGDSCTTGFPPSREWWGLGVVLNVVWVCLFAGRAGVRFGVECGLGLLVCG